MTSQVSHFFSFYSRNRLDYQDFWALYCFHGKNNLWGKSKNPSSVLSHCPHIRSQCSSIFPLSDCLLQYNSSCYITVKIVPNQFMQKQRMEGNQYYWSLNLILSINGNIQNVSKKKKNNHMTISQYWQKYLNRIFQN